MMSLIGDYLPVEGEVLESIGVGLCVRVITVTDMEIPRGY